MRRLKVDGGVPNRLVRCTVTVWVLTFAAMTLGLQVGSGRWSPGSPWTIAGLIVVWLLATFVVDIAADRDRDRKP